MKLQGYYSGSDYQQKVEDLIKKLEIKDVVEVLPYDPKDKVVKDATIFLNASLSEGFGMNMLESLGQAVPVITYAAAYTKDNLVEDGVNGYAVTTTTPTRLAQKAVDVLQDEELYKRLSQGASETAKKYSEEAFINSWKQILD